jgi:hypothetical protein
MIGRKNAYEVEWYDLFDCPDCRKRALLQGIREQRSLKLLFVRIPRGRRWYLRCQSCNATRKVDEQTWRQWREQGVTPQEAYLERQSLQVLARRSEVGSPLAAD